MRARRTDKGHQAVLDAIRAVGFPCMSLHTHGGGLEDIIVGVRCDAINCTTDGHRRWVLVEVKSTRNKAGTATASQFTKPQLDWYAQTTGFPRLVVTSAQEAVDKLRGMVR